MGGWFGLIKPQLDGYQKNKETIAKRNVELTELQSKLQLYQNASAQLSVQQNNHKQLTQRYYKKTSNTNLSKIITTEIQICQLTPVSLNMTSGQKQTNDQEGSEQTTLPKNITLSTVSIICDGDSKSYLKFIDQIRSRIKSAYISSFSYSVDNDSTSSVRFNTVLEIYMLNEE
jgi:lactam utilization protein B